MLHFYELTGRVKTQTMSGKIRAIFSAKKTVLLLLICIEIFLDSDWLREMQFSGNAIHKESNLVQKRGKNIVF